MFRELISPRQRRDFFYLTGCDLPDCAFIYSFKDQTTTLFIPDISPSSVIWSGLPISPTEALATYDVDSVNYMSTLTSYLSSLGGTVYAISNQYAHLPSTLQPSVTSLKSAIESCRVRKSPYEVALIRQANTTTNVAHTAVMRAARTAATERDLEALFINRCFLRDSPNQAYHSIVAAGTAAATLHYVNNRASLKDKLNLLLDAGAEYRNYASDVTRTFPINGKFTPHSRQIYDLVLKMQTETIAMLKADVLWEDVHIHAHRVAIAGLLELGILREGTVEEILENRTSTAFFPHGLGHYLGLDTHDVGGHPNYEDKDPMFQYLRIRGRIPEDSVVTVEPGIYFCEFIIEPFLKDDKHGRFINRAVLDNYWSVGGVRIEGQPPSSSPSHRHH